MRSRVQADGHDASPASPTRGSAIAAPTSADRYRVRDLWLAPSLLSLLRLPLSVCFVLTVDSPWAALAVLTLAGVSDLADGFVARRYGLATATGAALDGVTDKVFVLVVATTLVVTERLSLPSALLLGTRELGEAPLVVWFALNPKARARRAAHPKANVLGKLATVLQFGTVAVALFGAAGVGALTIVTAVAGVVAAVSYWRREI